MVTEGGGCGGCDAFAVCVPMICLWVASLGALDGFTIPLLLISRITFSDCDGIAGCGVLEDVFVCVGNNIGSPRGISSGSSVANRTL